MNIKKFVKKTAKTTIQKSRYVEFPMFNFSILSDNSSLNETVKSPVLGKNKETINYSQKCHLRERLDTIIFKSFRKKKKKKKKKKELKARIRI